MRFDAKFLVMRRAQIDPYPARVSIAHRAYTVVEALEFAARARRRVRPRVPVAYWIERRGWPARRPPRRLVA